MMTYPLVEYVTQELTDLPADEYHAATWAVSSTFLKNMFTHSPYYAASQRHIHVDTAALRLGRAVHTLILEGATVFNNTYEKKYWNARTKEGKELSAQALASGKTLLSPAEYEQVVEIHNAVTAHEEVLSILSDAPYRETSWFWQDKTSGVWCKARPDMFGQFIMCDLKTTANVHAFDRSAFKYAYPVQAAFYLRGWAAMRGADGRPDFPFIAVSTSAPYEVGVFRFDDDTLELADSLVGRMLEAYTEYEAERQWPTGLEHGQTLTATPWERDAMQMWEAR